MANPGPNKMPRPGPQPPAPDSPAMPPATWAKRTGFRPKFSGETNASDSGQITLTPPQPPASAQAKHKPPDSNLDLEAARPRPGPTSNGEAVVAKDRAKKKEREEKKEEHTLPVRTRRDSDGGKNLGADREGSRRAGRNDEAAAVDVLPQSVLDDDGVMFRNSHMKYELRDTPGLGKFFLFFGYNYCCDALLECSRLC